MKSLRKDDETMQDHDMQFGGTRHSFLFYFHQSSVNGLYTSLILRSLRYLNVYAAVEGISMFRVTEP